MLLQLDSAWLENEHNAFFPAYSSTGSLELAEAVSYVKKDPKTGGYSTTHSRKERYEFASPSHFEHVLQSLCFF